MKPKNKNIAGLLAIFLGTLGVHKFYLGKSWCGVLYILFCWTYIPTIVGVIEGIIYLTQSQESFDKKYNNLNKEISTGKDNNLYFDSSTHLEEKEKILQELDKISPTDFVDYHGFICGTEKFDVEKNNVYTNWFIFWEKMLEAYKEITIKQEEFKQYGDLENMKQFEKDLHIFFQDRVLKEAVKQGFIKDTKPEEKPNYHESFYIEFHKFMYRNLTKLEFEEAKKIFEQQQEQNRKQIKRTIYDLYCKSLRRVGNFYKNYKEYKLALNIFLQIKKFGFEGIMDGKSIIKCQKELEMIESKNKLLNK